MDQPKERSAYSQISGAEFRKVVWAGGFNLMTGSYDY